MKALVNLEDSFLVKIFIFLLFSFSILSKVAHFKSDLYESIRYSFQEICESKGLIQLPIIEAIGVRKIDCMGTKVSVERFCYDRHGGSPLYIRGVIKDDQVHCEKAFSVDVAITCSKGTRSFCENKQKSCLKLQKHFARSLTFEQMINETTQFRCLYRAQKKIDEELNGKILL